MLLLLLPPNWGTSDCRLDEQSGLKRVIHVLCWEVCVLLMARAYGSMGCGSFLLQPPHQEHLEETDKARHGVVLIEPFQVFLMRFNLNVHRREPLHIHAIGRGIRTWKVEADVVRGPFGIGPPVGVPYDRYGGRVWAQPEA